MIDAGVREVKGSIPVGGLRLFSCPTPAVMLISSLFTYFISELKIHYLYSCTYYTHNDFDSADLNSKRLSQLS